MLVAAFLSAFAAWFLIPMLTGLPWRPASRDRILRALTMARLQPGEVVYDLGSGDGRVLTLAAEEFGARAVGIELSPVLFIWGWVASRLRYGRDRIELRWANLFRTSLQDADVVFAYMTSSQAAPLQSRLEGQLRGGSRVVTVAFELEGWMPAAFDREGLIYLYELPPRPGSLSAYLAANS